MKKIFIFFIFLLFSFSVQAKVKSKDISFYDLKGVLQDLLHKFEGNCSYKECEIDFLHPGISALIKLNNKVIKLYRIGRPKDVEIDLAYDFP